MTQRKPAGMSSGTWIDKQIRAAEARGEFDNLPGAGKPIPGAGKPDDEMWWVRQLMRREQISYLPPSLALRKEIEDVMAKVSKARSEAAVRAMLTSLNDKIDHAIRFGIAGPAVRLSRVNVEYAVEQWRTRR